MADSTKPAGALNAEPTDASKQAVPEDASKPAAQADVTKPQAQADASKAVSADAGKAVPQVLEKAKASDAEQKKVSEAELSRLFADAGRRGAILALLHFDAYGKDKEVVRDAIVELVSRITREGGVIYCYGEVEEVREGKDKDGKTDYSTFTEVKVLFASISRAVSLCFKYAPIAVEILEPKELRLDAEAIQNTMLDASSISQSYTKFFMEKMLKGDEFAQFQEALNKRAAEGKRLVDNARAQNKD
ncbi:MAG: hypothetical protein V1708_03350 [Candidatus Micrarchaeota archaeon]